MIQIFKLKEANEVEKTSRLARWIGECAGGARGRLLAAVLSVWRICFEPTVDYERLFQDMKRTDKENRMALKIARRSALPLKEAPLVAVKHSLFQVFLALFLHVLSTQ
jgi:hypothetical protein